MAMMWDSTAHWVRCARSEMTGCTTPEFVWTTAEPVPPGESGLLQAAHRDGWRQEALSADGRLLWWCPAHVPSRSQWQRWEVDGVGVFSRFTACPECGAVDTEAWTEGPGGVYTYQLTDGAHDGGCALHWETLTRRRRLIDALARELGAPRWPS